MTKSEKISYCIAVLILTGAYYFGLVAGAYVGLAAAKP